MAALWRCIASKVDGGMENVYARAMKIYVSFEIRLTTLYTYQFTFYSFYTVHNK